MSTTFEVARRVSSAFAALPEDSLANIVEKEFGKPVILSDSETSVVTEGLGSWSKINHGLLRAAHLAFDDHRPLVLSPDIIWVTIAQGFAKHVNLNAEAYRSHFVSHEGKKRLEYWSNATPGSEALPWDKVVEIFSELVRKEIGDKTCNLMVSDFSTTGPVERTVSEVVLLDSMQSYFEYYGGTMCGIPSVTLEGTTADWEKLESKVAGLKALGGMDWWLDKVEIIAKQCVAASKGDVDEYFWNDLYKIANMSGGPYVNGWITHLVPYTVGHEDKPEKNPTLEGQRGGWGDGGITLPTLPTSMSCVPLTWNYYNQVEVKYEMLAGIIGVTQDENLALRPKLGWAIRLADSAPARQAE